MADQVCGPEGDDYLLIGRVAKAHGIKGEVKLLSYAEDSANTPHYRELLLRGGGSGDRLYAVARCRPQGKYAILTLAGVADRNAADALIGAEVWVARAQLPLLGDDEFYWHDLVGLAVETEEGGALGTVRGLMATGGHDVLVVAGRGREILIPARHEFIVGQDGERLVVALPPGLVEMNE